MNNFQLGDRVKINGKNANGEIAFIGETQFSDGIWIGVILDESKGRNNGAVNGTRYFKCPQNHGMFVRAYQIEKDQSDNADITAKPATTTSSKVTYPNYLRNNSKSKSVKQPAVTKSEEVIQKSKFDVKRNESKNEELDNHFTAINEVNEEVLKFQEEIEDLKAKLKKTEESLSDTIQKYDKALGDIKQLKDELDNRKKQINVQKYQLKLLEFMQCSQYKKAKMSTFESDPLKTNDSNASDSELESESMRVMASMQQRVSGLEEQNKIMIHGLLELRQFLKSCLAHSKKGEMTQNGESGQPNSPSLSSILKTELTPEESEQQLKEYANILSRMTCFSRKMIKENSGTFQSSNNATSNVIHKNYFMKEPSSDNRVVELTDSPPNRDDVSTKAKNSLRTPSSLQIESNEFEKTLNCKDNIQDYFRAVKCHNPQLLKMQSKLKHKTQPQYSSSPSDASHAVQELKDLISGIIPSSQNKECSSSTSLIERQVLVEVHDAKPRSSKSHCHTRYPMALPVHPLQAVIHPSGDNLLNTERGQKPKRMVFATRIYERKELTNSK